jgi:predicted nucleotidyltransferase
MKKSGMHRSKALTNRTIMKPSEALGAHREALRQLVSRYGLSRPRVFGSVATGTDGEDSDLDLLVEPAAQTSLFTLGGLQVDAEELLGVKVSVLTPNGLPPKFRQDTGSGRPFMKHPERIEDYLEHIAEAAAQATEYCKTSTSLRISRTTGETKTRRFATSRSSARRQVTSNGCHPASPPRIRRYRGRKCVGCATPLFTNISLLIGKPAWPQRSRIHLIAAVLAAWFNFNRVVRTVHACNPLHFPYSLGLSKE